MALSVIRGAREMVLAGLVAGCGAGNAAHHARAIDANAPAHVVLLPTLGRLVRVDDGSDAHRRYRFGALRVEIDARGAHIGTSRFGTPIAAAIEVANGWIFVAQDGTVAQSETFVGSLRRIGQTGVFGPEGARSSRGRAVVVDASGIAMESDGTTPLTPIRALQGRAILSAAFVDAREGAVLARDGTVSATHDGGATWHPVSLGGAVVTSVDRIGDALVVDTDRGPRGLGADHTLVAAAYVPPTRRESGDGARALDAALLAFPDLLPNLEAVPRADGVSLLVDHDTIIEVDRTNGRVLRRVRGMPMQGSMLVAWGSDVAIVNDPGDGGDPSAYRWHDDEAIPLAMPHNAVDAAFSDDAIHAVKLRACRGESARGPSVCVLDDGRGAWRTVRVGRALDRIVAMHGTRVLAHVENGPFVLFDVRDGALHEARAVGASTTIDAVTLAFTHDGIAGAGVDADGLRYALVGPSLDALHATPLPSGALVCGFADGRHGVAAGRTAARLWRTLDAGVTWTPLDPGIDGDASLVPLLTDPRAVYGAITCDTVRCQVGRAATVTSWGPLSPPSRDVLGPRTPSDASDTP